MSKQTNAIAISTIGVDTGKNTLHLVGLDRQGMIVLREKLARSRIGTRLANVPSCLIGIEAGMATHYVARELLALGHDVRQYRRRMPSRSVKDIRVTSGTLMQSRKLCSGRRHAAFRSRLTISWTCKRCTECDLAWSASGRL